MEHVTLLGPAAFSSVVAAVLALYFAPVVIRAAHRYGIVDRPTHPLKVQKDPVPYLGGLVVFLSFLVALSLTFSFDQNVLAILLMAALVVAVGLIDDLGTLTPRDKLAGQIIAAVVCVKAGVKIDIVALPFPADEVLSVLWLITCMNAFNIVDVSDGLATSAALVAAGGAAGVAWLNGEPMIIALAAALFGACAGFLWFNRQPARIYLGDTGALLLGALVGALAMEGRYSARNDVSALLVPLTLMAAPLFDLVLVVIARLQARKPIWHGSPDHYAVRLRRHGWSPRAIARLTLIGGAVVFAAGASSIFLTNRDALIVAGLIMSAGIGAILFFLVRLPPVLPSPEPRTPSLEAPQTKTESKSLV